MLSKNPPPLRLDVIEDCWLDTGGDERLENADCFGAACGAADDEKLKLLNASSRPPNDCFGAAPGDCIGGEDRPPNC